MEPAKACAVLGTTIGNYKVTAQVGQGGMGVVYMAEHPALGRKAAIKVLHQRLAADPEVVSRFFHEARASNAIRHPNIVEAYDYGTLPDGATYIIMEFLEGESLATRLDKAGRLPVRTALDFAHQAAGALAAAHDKAIVHRDLKPDNLFVTPDARMPGSELIKILDFGIAKLAAPVDDVLSHKTRTGAMLGTPLYMSPEQCLGVREVDHRTDIYSLGCILYEMLCGVPPFVSEGFGALVNMHINQPAEPPSRRSPEVPAAIDRVVLRMLAKDAGERFADMRAVQEALLVEIARAPTHKPGTTPAPGAARTPRASSSATTLSAAASGIVHPADSSHGHRRGVRAAMLAGAIALVVGVATALRSAPSAPPAGAAPASVPAAAASVPATPTPPSPPAAIEAKLESTPPGALVSVDGVAIGTTPTTWRVVPDGVPRTLEFSLAGYRREVIRTQPAEGLRLAPTLERQPARRARPSAGHRAAAVPADDIKSER
jgi:serine/threonine-protein kinase